MTLYFLASTIVAIAGNLAFAHGNWRELRRIKRSHEELRAHTAASMAALKGARELALAEIERLRMLSQKISVERDTLAAINEKQRELFEARRKGRPS